MRNERMISEFHDGRADWSFWSVITLTSPPPPLAPERLLLIWIRCNGAIQLCKNITPVVAFYLFTRTFFSNQLGFENEGPQFPLLFLTSVLWSSLAFPLIFPVPLYGLSPFGVRNWISRRFSCKIVKSSKDNKWRHIPRRYMYCAFLMTSPAKKRTDRQKNRK